MLTSLFGFCALIGILVTVHEYGHLIAAKQCGVKVEAFSVGFGPVLWNRIGKDGVDYRISAIPLGGYVKMKDEILMENKDEEGELAPADADSFQAQPWWQKVYIAFAGPLANLIFSVVAFAVIALLPKEVLPPIIASSNHAELTAGDRLISINNKDMQYPRHHAEYLMMNCLKENQLSMKFNGQYGERMVSVQPKSDDCLTSYVDGVYASLNINWQIPNRVAVMNGLPAQKAGVMDGDYIYSVNNVATPTYQNIVEEIGKAAGAPLELTLDGINGVRQVNVIPELITDNGNERHIIGVQFKGESYRSPLIPAVSEGFERTVNTIALTPLFITRMINKGEANKTLGGPIAIGKVAGSAVNAGLKAFLEVAAMLSISLAILNLLPIPVLDGGRIVQHSIEGIFLRRNISEAAVMRLQQIGMFFILALTFFALYNDITSL